MKVCFSSGAFFVGKYNESSVLPTTRSEFNNIFILEKCYKWHHNHIKNTIKVPDRQISLKFGAKIKMIIPFQCF